MKAIARGKVTRWLSWAGMMVIASAGLAEDEVQVRATIDLEDGSRIVGVPQVESVPVASSIATLELPLKRMRGLSVDHKAAELAVTMQNGDVIKGRIPDGGMVVDGLLGELEIPWTTVGRMKFSLFGGPLMPPGEGPLAFGGVNWTAWRVDAEVRDDKLVTLPRPRPGFVYGHGGNGRSATLVTNVGNEDWTDYRVEMDVVVAGVDPAFNPHGVRTEDIGVSIMFHVADMKESWNERGMSSYRFTLGRTGTWGLSCVYNHRCPGDRGYRTPLHDGSRKLANGDGISVANRKVNRVRIEVKGERIQVWVDDERLADVTDELMDEEVEGTTLDHGGVAVQWGWEGMGWIENFSATRL